jgi:hypothetical protein
VTSKLGLQSAVEEAVQGHGPEPEPEQLALPVLPLAPSEAVDDDGQVVRRGPGRPPGARNRSTLAMLEYLQGQYRSPLVALAETYSRTVDDLVGELGCKKLEAINLQVEAMKASLPYWHAKQPVAVQIDGKGLVTLIIENAVAAGGEAGDGALLIEGQLLDPDNEENQ